MLRYLKALGRTISLLLRGEVPQVLHPKLWAWIDEGQKRIDAVYAMADNVGIDEAKRKSLVIKFEGRATSLHVLLGGIHYHLHDDYPFVLRNYTQHSVTAIYANNMNDQFIMTKISDEYLLKEHPSLYDTITQLKDHLDNIPPSTEV